MEIRRWKSGRSRLPRIKKDSRVRSTEIPLSPSSFVFLRLFSFTPFSLTSVRDHVFPRWVTIKVEINFLIRFTLAWLLGDAGHAGIQPRRKDALSSLSLPLNLKFLIKVIADRGFLSASWISSPLCSRRPIVAADRLTATTACYY